MTRLFALLPVLAACGSDVLDHGTVEVCSAGDIETGDEVDLTLDGTITAIGADCSDSSLSFAVRAASGDEVTIGLTVTDGDGADITPDPALAIDEVVSLHYSYRLVFGDVAGFALSGADGLALAADEGFWGNALQASDIEGLDVSRGKDEVARERIECGDRVGYEIVFSGDDEVSLQPVDSSELTIGGSTVTATAVAAYDYEDGTNCSVEDRTGATAWAVSR